MIWFFVVLKRKCAALLGDTENGRRVGEVDEVGEVGKVGPTYFSILEVLLN